MIRALAEQEDCDVILVAQEEMPQSRLDCGWNIPDFGGSRIFVRPDEKTMNRILAETASDSAHIFSGIRSYPLVWWAFKRCSKGKAMMGILSEAGNWLGIKGKIRLLRSRIEALWFRRRIDFILAIGRLGVKWYKMSGYSKEKIYPFGYFVEKPRMNELDYCMLNQNTPPVFRLSFIGQLIVRKDVDLLLEALAALTHLSWHLEIVGDGPEKRSLESFSKNKGLQENVSFLGLMENREAMKVLSRSDLLILPSRWDGWGAVVNEALIRGVPVISSDYCGAADLLRSKERGSVMKAGSVESLKLTLEHWIETGPVAGEERAKIRQWSQRIEGQVAARYVREVIDHVAGKGPRSGAPWLAE